MTKQPEALRLADSLDRAANYELNNYTRKAAAELRRLHDENLRLRGIVPETLEQLNDGLCEENDKLRALNQELLEALCKLAALYDAMGAPRGPCRIMADAVIVKATGEH